MTFIERLKFLFTGGKPAIRIQMRDRCKLSLTDWRADDKLCAGGGKALNDATISLMLDVLRNEHPGYGVMNLGSSDTDRIVWQARAEGYTMCLSNLEAMGKAEAQHEPLEATFEALEAI